MSEAPESSPGKEGGEKGGKKRSRAWRILKRVALALCVALLLVTLVVGIAVKDHVRTLWSLRRIPNTNMYCMDYYGTYNIREIRENGVDVTDIEGSLIRTFFPSFLVPLANDVAESTEPQAVARPDLVVAHRCSTVSFRTESGQVLFGRNFDWSHDSCLILTIHGRDGYSSVAVLDLHYLGLDQRNLEDLGVLEKVRLLFAPYLVMDGMNEHGLAVSEMACKAEVSFDDRKPNVNDSLAMRLMLDYARDADEAVALLREYNVHFEEIACHFMVADAGGRSLIVEFVDGEMRTLPADDRWQVCTNNTMSGKSEAERDAACDRYQRASDRLVKLGDEIDCDRLRRVMASISAKDWTMWTSLYNLTGGQYQVVYRRQFDAPYADRLAVDRGGP
ncbi:MAG: linear amide C-N hydrolase [Pirellulales bacterium]|nr:linear amide C-N hydrolase [Pirellulales bacterium]